MSDSSTLGTLQIQGGCFRCSRDGVAVFHPGISWCPRIMATIWTDWNAADTRDGHTFHFLWPKGCSRPVGQGEGVILTDQDSVLAYGIVLDDRTVVEVPIAPPQVGEIDFWRSFWTWIYCLSLSNWTPPAVTSVAAGPSSASTSESGKADL